MAFTDLTPGRWAFDPAHSELTFVARHLVVTKVRGSFTEWTGEVTVGEDLADSKVSVTAQAASITTGNADRDNHLRTADFLEVETYPTLTFTSTKVTETSLEGDLTIKGVTKPVVFDIEYGGVAADPWGGTRAGFEASTDINRKDFGVTFNAAVEGTGSAVVSDKIKLEITVELVRDDS